MPTAGIGVSAQGQPWNVDCSPLKNSLETITQALHCFGMRIAVVSSPRSGNTWLRRILVQGLNLQEIAVHNYLDVKELPENCVLQLHWYREPNFQKFLDDHGFRIITLARHPLDVLLSVLHFVKYEPETAKWLGGNCLLPDGLRTSSPNSKLFLDYALSFGCENLLSVSYQWWHEKSALKVRYEALVSDTTSEIEQIADLLGVSGQALTDALAPNSIEMFQALPNRHGWQGRSGLWRELIPTAVAEQIASRHSLVLQTLGYTVEPTDLTRAVAEARWMELSR